MFPSSKSNTGTEDYTASRCLERKLIRTADLVGRESEDSMDNKVW